MTLFPGTMRSIAIGRPVSIAAIERHLAESAPLMAIPQLDPAIDDPAQAELAGVGVLAQVLRVVTAPSGTMQVLVEGVERVVRTGAPRLSEGALLCPIEQLPEPAFDDAQVVALSEHAADLYQQYMTSAGVSPDDHAVLAAPRSEPDRVADQIASQLDMAWEDRLALLEAIDTTDRLQLAIDRLAIALARQELSTQVSARVQAALDKGQRDFHLKEQLKAIQEELGEAETPGADADSFLERIEASGMPEHARKDALREVQRLRRIHMDSAEYTIIRTWLEAMVDLPWAKFTTDTTDLREAERVLDEDHFGLAEVKERILEYLAVRQLKPDSKGPILCFVGPPGVGKTSLGQSIARALGRNLGRIALGGVKDETEVRGHRRTYIGALPGRIIRGLIRAESRNPVLLLDEMDKVGNDVRGDPASALLEVLDPEQNHAFVDHYIDTAVDLSQVLFIGTANVVDTIPPALMDRLEIIEIPGYTEEEKLQIARRFLLPRQAFESGLNAGQLSMTQSALQRLIRDYTREAGVRGANRQLSKIHRKVARQVVEGRTRKVRITDKGLPRYLGPQRYFREIAERVDQPGVVIGLAWTPTGGDILFVEATRMPGKYELKLTGLLGNVMKESVEAAMSWLRTHALRFGVPAETFEAGFHLHVPAGGIPKDGPSAGVTMVTALTSICTGRPVRPALAMTGEMTLRGKVLPVGGIKEKVLAARRAGVTTVVMPKHNERDLLDLKPEMRKSMTFHFVETVEEVLAIALTEAKP